MFGEPLTADSALEVGLLYKVLPASRLNFYAKAKAAKLAAKPIGSLGNQAADETRAATRCAAENGRRRLDIQAAGRTSRQGSVHGVPTEARTRLFDHPDRPLRNRVIVGTTRVVEAPGLQIEVGTKLT